MVLVSGNRTYRNDRTPGVEVIQIRTAREMRDRLHLEESSIIKSAAVADFHLASAAGRKTAARLSLELDPTLDILAELAARMGDR
ncbi:MAG: phosphopantothenoylcysteine decarboxylase [Bryobacteraceae bacterium]